MNRLKDCTYEIEFPEPMTVTGDWLEPEPDIGIPTWGFSITACSLPSYLEDEDWVIEAGIHVTKRFEAPGTHKH